MKLIPIFLFLLINHVFADQTLSFFVENKMEDLVVEDPENKRVIWKEFDKNKELFIACYSSSKITRGGKITVQFVIQKDVVKSAGVSLNSLNAATGSCVIRVIKSLMFSIPNKEKLLTTAKHTFSFGVKR